MADRRCANAVLGGAGKLGQRVERETAPYAAAAAELDVAARRAGTPGRADRIARGERSVRARIGGRDDDRARRSPRPSRARRRSTRPSRTTIRATSAFVRIAAPCRARSVRERLGESVRAGRHHARRAHASRPALRPGGAAARTRCRRSADPGGCRVTPPAPIAPLSDVASRTSRRAVRPPTSAATRSSSIMSRLPSARSFEPEPSSGAESRHGVTRRRPAAAPRRAPRGTRRACAMRAVNAGQRSASFGENALDGVRAVARVARQRRGDRAVAGWREQRGRRRPSGVRRREVEASATPAAASRRRRSQRSQRKPGANSSRDGRPPITRPALEHERPAGRRARGTPRRRAR